MLDPKNVWNGTCGLVVDPEVIDSANGKIVKLRVAVDYAGQEKGSDNRSGYFDVTFYANSDNTNAKFVLSQIDKGNFKKGSQLQILGRLSQERWASEDGKKSSKVVIIAESIGYAGGSNPNAIKPAVSTSEDAPASLPTSF